MIECLLLELFSKTIEAFEVLCKQGAYVVKRCAKGCEKPACAQVTWSRYGGAMHAWQEACSRAGVELPALAEKGQ